MLRLAHISDIHIGSPQVEWTVRDWFTKRLTSWANSRLLGRGLFFKSAEEVTDLLMHQLKARAIDHIVFSGDATVLGFESEMRRAAELLRVNAEPIPGLAVPGNHDYCTHAAAASGLFERYFAPWLKGERVDGHVYPFAQRVGPVWLIGVNAAIGNVLPWDARGKVGVDQLDRLRQLLGRLDASLKILVVHFPVRLKSGRREMPFHGLRDLDALVDVALEGGVRLWLHGHRHSPYYFQDMPMPGLATICAGTATQRGIWSYNEYSIDGEALQAVRRAFDPKVGEFRDVETFSLHLKCL